MLNALLQTFAVPGSVFLNVLAGAIFGSYSGFMLCCLLTACGASLCYFLARYSFPVGVLSYVMIWLTLKQCLGENIWVFLSGLYLCRLVGEGAVATWFPNQLESFRMKLEENKSELPFFLLFLRLFPMSPNWYKQGEQQLLIKQTLPLGPLTWLVGCWGCPSTSSSSRSFLA